ncbi:MAG: hypothetical protein FWE61_04570, partial [Micrococcales bacterium]|nr:hypothetical protein [Micrococcales bacterium]
MAINPHLAGAVAVFTELGWGSASYDDVATLPLGNDQQRKTALAGLRSGEWVSDEHANGQWVSHDHVGVNRSMLALFAIRVGVSVSRAATLLDMVRPSACALVEVVVGRGPRFVEQLVGRAARTQSLAWDHGEALVRLVVGQGLPVPGRRPYLEEWVDVARTVLVGQAVDDEDLVSSRFADHIRAAVALGVGQFGDVLGAGVARGWLDRDEAVDLVLTAIDTATRPSDRRHWLRVWLDAQITTDDGPVPGLAVSDDEVLAHADALVPVLASGESPVVERLASVLVAAVDDDRLADVVTAALCGPTSKKACRAVLAALAARPRPSTAEAIEPHITALSSDKSLAGAVATVVGRWGLAVAAPDDVVQGWWRPVPPVWQVPRFDRGEVSLDAFTALNAELFGRVPVVDLTTERFLAVANELARRGRG